MYYTTGFDMDDVIDICTRIACAEISDKLKKWPPSLGLFGSVAATLCYMRHNDPQAKVGEEFGVSQSTISRAVSVITPLLAECMREFAPTADDLDPEAQYIVDGTLLPCWSWKDMPELYSGKHKATGVNVQLACSIYGRLSWISDPVTGNHHDSYSLGDSEVLLALNPENWMGDKGYVGNDMITPFKKPAGGELLDWQREFNSGVNKIRWMIEQVISHFKNWKIMSTDYRRPFKTFAVTISAVALVFHEAWLLSGAPERKNAPELG